MLEARMKLQFFGGKRSTLGEPRLTFILSYINVTVISIKLHNERNGPPPCAGHRYHPDWALASSIDVV